MLYREIVAVCSEIHIKHITQITFKYPSPYRAVNTLRLGYTNQSLNVV